MGPAPMSEALKDGATIRTADSASSIGVCTNFVSNIWTRLEVGDGGEPRGNCGRLTTDADGGSWPCSK